MLVTLLACLYITLVCWAWGRFLIRLLNNFSVIVSDFIFSITCIAGLCFIMTILGILTLIIPLGGWLIQLFFLLPSIYILLTELKTIFKLNIKEAFTLLPSALFLFLIAFTLVLVMSTWKIIHPDTLGYHAQLIQWAEKYKTIPGIVNLNARYGLQRNWFIACSFFGFKFTGTTALTFLNIAILFWFLIFIVNKINNYLKSFEYTFTGLFWIILLGFSFWSYTQIRLTATSASPDFFSCMLIWLCIYLFTEKKEQTGNVSYTHYFLIALIGATAITAKLSALPVLLFIIITVYYLFKQKKIKFIFITAGIVTVTILPLLIRNVLTSGYPFFPSTFGGFPVDWKLSEVITNDIAQYVKVYARTAQDYSVSAAQEVMQMNPVKWIPLWWNVLSLADKMIMSLLVISLISIVVLIKKILKADHLNKIALSVCLLGIIFWFSIAPDPRFGFGFVFGFIGITCNIIFSKINFNILTSIKKINIASVLFVGMLLSVYLIYRYKNFYTAANWLKPMGIEKVACKTIACNGMNYNLQLSNAGCGDAALPCVYDSCASFINRGNKITDGYKPK